MIFLPEMSQNNQSFVDFPPIHMLIFKQENCERWDA